MFIVEFHPDGKGFSDYKHIELTVDSIEVVDRIVDSGANVCVRNSITKEWRDACGGCWVSDWGQENGPATIIV